MVNFISASFTGIKNLKFFVQKVDKISSGHGQV
jgi:hypothetical protein